MTVYFKPELIPADSSSEYSHRIVVIKKTDDKVFPLQVQEIAEANSWADALKLVEGNGHKADCIGCPNGESHHAVAGLDLVVALDFVA